MEERPGFFMPYMTEVAAAWEWCLSESGGTGEALFRIEYLHEGDRYVVEVGKPRQRFQRQSGPRGGYIKNAEPETFGRPTGTEVYAIVRAPTLVYVFSLPPYAPWANPSLVGINELQRVVSFSTAPPDVKTDVRR